MASTNAATALVSCSCASGMIPSLRRALTMPSVSPAALLALRLLFEPIDERLEVVDDGGCVRFGLAAEGRERLGPSLARAHREHRLELLSRGFVSVDRASGERAGVPRDLAQRAVELELIDAREEIPDVRDARGHVVFRARIEVLFAARR